MYEHKNNCIPNDIINPDIRYTEGPKGDKGDKGDKGADGITPTLKVGSVTTLAAGSNATVTMSENSNEYTLNFGIPKGAKGDTGASGSGVEDLSNITSAINLNSEKISELNSQMDTNTNEIDKLKSDKIKFIAHKGFVALAPENTLKSTEKACENGFSMVEMDVSQTKDFKYILIHDSTIDRTTNGSGGTWLYTFDEIQQFNIDSGVLFEDEILKIPSFEECVEMCGKYRVGVNLDCSKLAYTESNFRYFIQLLKDNNIFNKSCIATNTTEKRLDIMKVDSNTTLLWVSSLANLEADIKESWNYKNVIIGYNSTAEIPTNEQIKILHDNNVKILMYGVNSYENYLKIKGLNVDYIETETIFPNGGDI